MVGWSSGVGWGWGGGGGRGYFEGKCGTGVRANISKPTPFIYLAFEKMVPFIYLIVRNVYSYTALLLLYPFIAGSYTNIAVNSLNTKRNSSLDKSLSETNIRFYRDVKKVGLFLYESRQIGSVIYFLLKKRGYILGSAEKEGHSARTSVLYRVTHPPSPPHPSPEVLRLNDGPLLNPFQIVTA